MALKLYPIGMQTFSEIREKDMLYVDKTEYVYRMSHGSGKFFFLSRPRRFGKSLLLLPYHSSLPQARQTSCPGFAHPSILPTPLYTAAPAWQQPHKEDAVRSRKDK